MYGEGLSGLNFPGVEGVSSRLLQLRESCDIGENEFSGKLKTPTNPKNPNLFFFLGGGMGMFFLGFGFLGLRENLNLIWGGVGR